jgi:hypothetical protein
LSSLLEVVHAVCHNYLLLDIILLFMNAAWNFGAENCGTLFQKDGY